MTSVRILKCFWMACSLLVCANLTSCVTWTSEVDDLAIVDIDSVNLVDANVEGGWRVSDTGEGRRFLRIEVATSADILQLATDRGVSEVNSVMYFCDEGPATRYIFTGRGIYTGETELLRAFGSNEPERNARRLADGRYLFSILLENPAPIVMEEYVDGEQVQVGVVDVLNPSKPVCFHFYAASLGVQSWIIKSNAVTLQTWSQIMRHVSQ